MKKLWSLFGKYQTVQCLLTYYIHIIRQSKVLTLKTRGFHQYKIVSSSYLILIIANAAERAALFVLKVKERAEHYKTNLLLVPFGDDFKFEKSDYQFQNMDFLMKYINTRNYGVRIRYATLSDYFETLHKNFNTLKFPVVRQDFFPYAGLCFSNYFR
jgi:hypothetical protein